MIPANCCQYFFSCLSTLRSQNSPQSVSKRSLKARPYFHQAPFALDVCFGQLEEFVICAVLHDSQLLLAEVQLLSDARQVRHALLQLRSCVACLFFKPLEKRQEKNVDSLRDPYCLLIKQIGGRFKQRSYTYASVCACIKHEFLCISAPR